MVARGTYSLPEELARHATRESFAPDKLRGACREAGEALGWEDARKAIFRTAAQMVEIWRGLDLPAWEAPYVLRAARLGYLNGYERALISASPPIPRKGGCRRRTCRREPRNRVLVTDEGSREIHGSILEPILCKDHPRSPTRPVS